MFNTATCYLPLLSPSSFPRYHATIVATSHRFSTPMLPSLVAFSPLQPRKCPPLPLPWATIVAAFFPSQSIPSSNHRPFFLPWSIGPSSQCHHAIIAESMAPSHILELHLPIPSSLKPPLSSPSIATRYQHHQFIGLFSGMRCHYHRPSLLILPSSWHHSHHLLPYSKLLLLYAPPQLLYHHLPRFTTLLPTISLFRAIVGHPLHYLPHPHHQFDDGKPPSPSLLGTSMAKGARSSYSV